MNPSYFVAVPIRNAEGTVVATDTIRYDKFVRRLLKAETAKEEAYHILAGVVGELGELYACADAENKLEELGDLCFYLEAGLQHYGKTESELPILSQTPHVMYALSCFADVVKREYTYNKPRDSTKVHEALQLLLTIREEELSLVEFTLQDILQANAEKLSERYKNLTYTDEEAIARADKNGKEE